MTPEECAARAAALEGVRYRLGGRDPATGLDCIGVVLCAIDRRDLSPTGYALRNSSIERFLPLAGAAGLVRVDPSSDVSPGDILLGAPGPAQHHLAVALPGDRHLHAHAGLRRVVIQPGPLPWPLVARWRFANWKV